MRVSKQPMDSSGAAWRPPQLPRCAYKQETPLQTSAESAPVQSQGPISAEPRTVLLSYVHPISQKVTRESPFSAHQPNVWFQIPLGNAYAALVPEQLKRLLED